VTSRLVAEGLFERVDMDSNAAVLLVSRCSRCDEVVFPRMQDCPNCVGQDTMRPDRVSGRGRLQDFVIAQRGPTGFRTPYIQAYVKLDSGLVIYGNVEGVEVDESAIAPGLRVEMRVGVIRRVDDVDVVGWTFRPIEGPE
jgi:uncharacterized OB-fold protein